MNTSQFVSRLKKIDAPQYVINEFSDDKDPQSNWDQCRDPQSMAWILGSFVGDPQSQSRKDLVLCLCEMARLSLKYVKKGEDRPSIALETAERWARNEAGVTLEYVKKASENAAASDAVSAYVSAYASAYASASAYVSASASAYVSASASAYVSADASASASAYAACADIIRKHYPKVPSLCQEKEEHTTTKVNKDQSDFFTQEIKVQEENVLKARAILEKEVDRLKDLQSMKMKFDNHKAN